MIVEVKHFIKSREFTTVELITKYNRSEDQQNRGVGNLINFSMNSKHKRKINIECKNKPKIE